MVGAMRVLPHCVMCDALFLFMGLSGLQGNQLFERLKLLVTEESLYPPLPFTKDQVPHLQMHMYTVIQFAAVAVPFILVQTRLALAFPICLLLSIPLHRSIPGSQVVTCLVGPQRFSMAAMMTWTFQQT